jgi:hypothetical protein
VRAFNEVLAVEPQAAGSTAEGMITYEDLSRACLAQGVMPAVVPQLKTITLGGALAGVGIESSSHRHGLVHDTMLELDVLLGDGRVRHVHARQRARGSLLRLPELLRHARLRAARQGAHVPVKPYVQLRAPAVQSGDNSSRRWSGACARRADFVDGTVFSPGEMYLTLGASPTARRGRSDYTYERIYYRSIREKREDYLTSHDYIWRWDTDWFWCSKNVLAQNPLSESLYGRKRLGSRTYTKIMRWNSRVGITKKIERVLGLHSESVIQDVDIPLGARAGVPRLLCAEIALWPMWTCPIGPQALGTLLALSGARRVVRELRLLGREAHARGASAGALQPPDRAQGGRARRHQVALLGFVLSARGIRRRATAVATSRAQGRSTTPRARFRSLTRKCVLRGLEGGWPTGEGLLVARLAIDAADRRRPCARRRSKPMSRPQSDTHAVLAARHALARRVQRRAARRCRAPTSAWSRSAISAATDSSPVSGTSPATSS